MVASYLDYCGFGKKTCKHSGVVALSHFKSGFKVLNLGCFTTLKKLLTSKEEVAVMNRKKAFLEIKLILWDPDAQLSTNVNVPSVYYI